MFSQLQLERLIVRDEQILRDPRTPPGERRATQQRIRDRRARLAARQKTHERKPTSVAEIATMTWTEYFAGYLGAHVGLLEVLRRFGSVPKRFEEAARKEIESVKV